MKLRINDNGRHFETEDGTPFFWLADTAWNTPLRGDEAEWETYLAARRRQGFTVIQFICTHWRGCSQPIGGRLYEERDGRLVHNEAGWAYLDRWFAAIRRHGLVPAPVMLWGVFDDCPGIALSEPHAIELARRMFERWDDGRTVWFLSGDIEHRSAAIVRRWLNIGRGVFGDRTDALATLHVNGGSWPEPFLDEPWFRFAGFQSGHGNEAADIQRLVNGPFSYRWRDLAKPFLNLEPAYEFGRPYGAERGFTRHEVRRALWWSLLATPTAGVSYGSNPIWIWVKSAREDPERHEPGWPAGHWSTGLETPVVKDIGTLLGFLLQRPWHQLRPANEYLFDQPGDQNPHATIKLARTPDDTFWLAYLPAGGTLGLNDFNPADWKRVQWWSPEKNTFANALPATTDLVRYQAPDPATDWIWLAER